MKKALFIIILIVSGIAGAKAQTNTISGNIILDTNKGFMHDSFIVWLITFNPSTNILAAVDSQLIINNHNYSFPYSFNNKVAGQYRVKAAWGPNGPKNVPDSPMPTYHDSSAMWSSAQLINHTGNTSSNKHIYMRYGFVTSGPGFVGGNVSSGANKGTTNGIEGMQILLLDDNNNVVTDAITDINGDYSFSNLPNATYKIHPEHLGYTTTAASLNITASQASINGINFERSLSQKTIKPKSAGISNINDKEPGFVLYPHPAKDVVNIIWPAYTDHAAIITITDISGKMIYNNEARMNANVAIDIKELQAGFYFLNVATLSGTNTQKLVIQ